jgi:hypothetical protein
VIFWRLNINGNTQITATNMKKGGNLDRILALGHLNYGEKEKNCLIVKQSDADLLQKKSPSYNNQSIF